MAKKRALRTPDSVVSVLEGNCDPPTKPPTVVPDLFPDVPQSVVIVDQKDCISGSLGFLQLCIERRFHRAVQTVFERLTELDPHDYWKHSDFGGTPKMQSEDDRAQYAYNNGARVMGWSAHGSSCGAFKPPLHPHAANDDEISVTLITTLFNKVMLYPEAVHYGLFATYDKDCNVAVYVYGPISSSPSFKPDH